jgi:hypothetical protein
MRFRTVQVLGICLSLLLMFGRGWAQEARPTEYQLKAAFLFNFAKFVEWPPEAFTGSNSPMVICVLGPSPFGSDLAQTIQGKSVNGRPLNVQEVRSASEARKCHILFISAPEQKKLPEIFESLRGSSVLTVSETERFTEAGGMINFVSQDNKIRFQINDKAARSAGLKISSKLLSLALKPTD